MNKVKTNFRPDAPSLGGVKIPNDATNDEELDIIKAEILNTGGNFFGSLNDLESVEKEGFYFKQDPAENLKNSVAFFKIAKGSLGHPIILFDPVTTSSVNEKDSENALGFRKDHFDKNYQVNAPEKLKEDFKEDQSLKAGESFFTRLSNVGEKVSSGSGVLGLDHRLWLFCSDDYLIWKSWTIQEQRTSGVGIVWFNMTSENDHYTRNEVPAIAARSLKNWPFNKAIAPAHETESRAMQLEVDEQIRMLPNRGDTRGREIIQPQVAYTPNKPLPAFWGEIPGILVVRSDAVAVWNTIELEGKNWVCFHKANGRGYLTRYENDK